MTLTRLLPSVSTNLVICSLLHILPLFSQSSANARGNGEITLPTSARARISAVLGREQRAYQAAARPGGFRLENPNNLMTTDFTTARVCFHLGTAEWGLKFRSYGYGNQLTISKSVAPLANANRVEYQRGALNEWYENGPMGLEQGFRLEHPPGKSRGQPLTVELVVSGNMLASVAPDRRGLTLAKNGMPTLRYSGLEAHDRTGHELRTWMDSDGGRLRLRVDDSGAQYPLVIDPIVQQASLTASDGGAQDAFGAAIAVSGDTVVVGAPMANGYFGEAYIFVKPAGGWSGALTETAKLRPIDGNPFNNFGNSVAISGDTVVVGSPYGFGEAYVYVKPAAGWSGILAETADLIDTDRKEGSDIGSAVAISGDTIVVGADGRSVPVPPLLPGVINLYVKPATGWGGELSENAKLVPGVRYPNTIFGGWLGIDGDTVVAGLLNGSEAYVFVRPAAGWNGGYTENAILRASNGTPIGPSVGVSGDTIVAGAPTETIGGVANQGAAYVFTKPATGWSGFLTETAKLTAYGEAANSGFAFLVAASGDTVVAYPYVFLKPAAGWTGTLTQAAVLSPPDGADNPPNGFYGEPGPWLAVDGTTFAIGAPDHAIGQNAGQGWAWIYGGTPADFSLSTPLLTIPLAGSGSAVTTVQSLYQFAGTVNLSVSPTVPGVTVSQTPTQITLTAGTASVSNIQVSVEPYLTPRTLVLKVIGTSGTTVRPSLFRVKIVPSIDSLITVVNALVSLGCIDTFETRELTEGLAKIQNYINAHNIRTAEMALSDLINQMKTQGAHHFRSNCRKLNVRFKSLGVLIADMQALEAALNNSRLP